MRHKGLKRLYEDDDSRGVDAQHAEKLRDILARLDAARVVTDMDLPGFPVTCAQRRVERLLGNYGSSQLASSLPLYGRGRERR